MLRLSPLLLPLRWQCRRWPRHCVPSQRPTLVPLLSERKFGAGVLREQRRLLVRGARAPPADAQPRLDQLHCLRVRDRALWPCKLALVMEAVVEELRLGVVGHAAK